MQYLIFFAALLALGACGEDQAASLPPDESPIVHQQHQVNPRPGAVNDPAAGQPDTLGEVHRR